VVLAADSWARARAAALASAAERSTVMEFGP